MNTLEDIMGMLRYYGNGPDIRRVIAETISRLPEEIARFSLGRCLFICLGRGMAGTTLTARIIENRKRDHIIVLSEIQLRLLDLETALSVIAHEIAHAWLNHSSRWRRLGHSEALACLQTGEWGFKGYPADPVEYQRVISKLQEIFRQRGLADEERPHPAQ